MGMNFLIVSGNPKKTGLCHSITEAVRKGAEAGGASVEIITLENLERCHVCGGGWGSCRQDRTCAFGNDGFTEAQKAVKSADTICLITPVYWGEMAESLKCFLDRLRRCESSLPRSTPRPPEEKAALAGKQVLLVASPGGSGNGMVSCLDQMDRFCRHTGAVIFDYIGVNRWNSDYKKTSAFSAARAMAEGRKNGDTISSGD